MQLQEELHTPVKLGPTGACYLRYPPPRSKKSRAGTQLINKKHSYFYENISVKLFLTVKNTVLRITFRKNVNFTIFKDFSQKTLRKLASAAQHRPQTLEKPPFLNDTPCAPTHAQTPSSPIRYQRRVITAPVTLNTIYSLLTQIAHCANNAKPHLFVISAETQLHK